MSVRMIGSGIDNSGNDESHRPSLLRREGALNYHLVVRFPQARF
ncbi:MAG: hypothetical protein ABGZ23_02620 [Fuerstiella sp.]